MIKFGDVQNVEEVLACDANEFWPQMVIQFYEKRLKWIAPAQQPNANVDTNPIEDVNIDENEKPEAVLCTSLFIFFRLSAYLCANQVGQNRVNFMTVHLFYSFKNSISH